jgi:hypothetical protein
MRLQQSVSHEVRQRVVGDHLPIKLWSMDPQLHFGPSVCMEADEVYVAC